MTAHVHSTQTEIAEAFGRWMKRRIPPREFAGDDQAEADELASLLRTLTAYAPRSDAASWVAHVLGRIEARAKHRTWPSAGEVTAACEEANARTSSDGKPVQGGDRSKLNRDQLYLLDTQILPTARRWAAIPGLAHHGRQTLAFWGEEA